VESRCASLELGYLFGSMGEFEHLPPIRGPARRCAATARRGRRPPSGKGDRTLPFSPARDELVVLHNDKNLLEDVRCVS